LSATANELVVDALVDVNSKGSGIVFKPNVLFTNDRFSQEHPSSLPTGVVSSNCSIQGIYCDYNFFIILEGAKCMMHNALFSGCQVLAFAGAMLSSRVRNLDRTVDNNFSPFQGHITVIRGLSNMIGASDGANIFIGHLTLLGSSCGFAPSDQFRSDGEFAINVNFGGNLYCRQVTLSGVEQFGSRTSARPIGIGVNGSFNVRHLWAHNVEQQCITMYDNGIARVEEAIVSHVGAVVCAQESSSFTAKAVSVDGAQTVAIARDGASVHLGVRPVLGQTGNNYNQYENVNVAIARAEVGGKISIHNAPTSIAGFGDAAGVGPYSIDGMSTSHIRVANGEPGIVTEGTVEGLVCDRFPAFHPTE